jgi:hypothetical protein
MIVVAAEEENSKLVTRTAEEEDEEGMVGMESVVKLSDINGLDISGKCGELISEVANDEDISEVTGKELSVRTGLTVARV